MRGRYPAKFSGLIWNTQGLHRPWGAMFWGYNQECLHYSWAAANHLELQQPYFSMHMRNYERYATAARQQWGSDGLFICETEAHNGPELLPDQIAADLQAFMLRGTEPSPELADFASRRHDHLSRWQIYPTYWTTFTTINASEKAEHFWKHYLYTGDRQFLAEQAYPMLKGAALFYCRFPNLRMEADGYYHIWRTNHHEHILGGRDVIDDLSFIRGVMQAAMKAAEILDTDDDLRKEWQDVLDHVTPYHLSSQPDAIGAITHPQGKETWCQGLQPATATRGLFGAESPRLRMLENYDLLTLETKDQHLDTHGEWELANQTFEAHPGYRSNMEMGNYQYAGGRYLLDAARLGRCEYMTILYEQNQRINQRTKGSVNQLGFTTSDLEELQGYGIFSAGLQEGLMQSIAPLPGLDPVIRVFPAWDKARFAAFTLLAQGGFLVSSAVEHGEVVFVSVESQLGGPCRIRNPWPEHDCHVYRNGSLETSIRQSLISFPTRTGDQIILMNH